MQQKKVSADYCVLSLALMHSFKLKLKGNADCKSFHVARNPIYKFWKCFYPLCAKVCQERLREFHRISQIFNPFLVHFCSIFVPFLFQFWSVFVHFCFIFDPFLVYSWSISGQFFIYFGFIFCPILVQYFINTWFL